MRTHGTLIQWNDERGFGFIEPAVGTAKIFVHISAFPRDGIRPRIGELVSFDIEQRSDGKQRALRLMRPGSRAAPHRAARTLPTAVRRNRFAEIAGLVIALAIVWYGYTHWGAQDVVSPAPLRIATDLTIHCQQS
ncbi:MAG TPA: cold shock domain-containing protein [Rhodanobacter sp.]